MCFYPNRHSKLLVATEDITCYKTVNISLHQSDSMLTLKPLYNYNRFRYKLGVTHKVSNSIFPTLKKLRNIHGFEVRGGAFHSYKTYNRVLEASAFMMYRQRHTFKSIIVQCTIPKGTKYMMNRTEYVSEQLRIDYILLNKSSRNFVETSNRSRFLKLIERFCNYVYIN